MVCPQVRPWLCLGTQLWPVASLLVSRLSEGMCGKLTPSLVSFCAGMTNRIPMHTFPAPLLLCMPLAHVRAPTVQTWVPICRGLCCVTLWSSWPQAVAFGCPCLLAGETLPSIPDFWLCTARMLLQLGAFPAVCEGWLTYENIAKCRPRYNRCEHGLGSQMASVSASSVV